MAFDMQIAGTALVDQIDDDEEYLFILIEEHNLDCPILSAIWESFYEGPRIFPNQANSISEELALIDQLIKSTPKLRAEAQNWGNLHLRLKKFFAEASRLNAFIRCLSD